MSRLAAVAGLTGALVAVLASPAAAKDRCFGERATITDEIVAIGTPGDDVIVARKAVAVEGRGGDDLVCVHRSVLLAIIETGAGDDRVKAGRGEATIATGKGNDFVRGGRGGDVVSDGSGADVYRGGGGRDAIGYGGAPGPVQANLTTGGGFAAGEFDRFRGFEDVTGSRWDDFLVGSDQANSLAGGLGDDVVVGDDGGDLLVGGPGQDSAHGGRGHDGCYTEQRDNCEGRIRFPPG